MIVNSPTSNHIHIIVDETDLKNKKIPLNDFISNPKNTDSLISKLLDDISISSANVFTYQFKIFYIDVIL
jgi:hypothetical protein